MRAEIAWIDLHGRLALVERIAGGGLHHPADLDEASAAPDQEVAAQEIAAGDDAEIAAAVVGRLRRIGCGKTAAHHQCFRQRRADIDDIGACLERNVAAAQRAEGLEEGGVVDPGRGLAGDRARSRAIRKRCSLAVHQTVRLAIVNVPVAPHLSGRGAGNAGLAAVGIGRHLDADDRAAGRHGHRAAAGGPGRRADEAVRRCRIFRGQRRRIEVRRRGRDSSTRGINRARRHLIEKLDIAGGGNGDGAGAGAHQGRDVDGQALIFGRQHIRIRGMSINRHVARDGRRQRRHRDHRIGIDRERVVGERGTGDKVI